MKTRALRIALPALLSLSFASHALASAPVPARPQALTGGQRARLMLRKIGKGLAVAAHVGAPFAAYYISKHVGTHDWLGYVSVDPRDVAVAASAGVVSVFSAIGIWGRNLPAGSHGVSSDHGVGYRIDQHGHMDLVYGNTGLGGVTQSLTHPGHIEMNLGANQTMDLIGGGDNN